jgi:ATP-dependent Lhr-like helicase
MFPFQRETWRLMGEGQSGLLHATTGSGKTLAVAFGAYLAATETTEPDDELRGRSPRTPSDRCARLLPASPPPTPQDPRLGGSAPAPETRHQANARRWRKSLRVFS